MEAVHGCYCHTMRRSNSNANASIDVDTVGAPLIPSIISHPDLPPNGQKDVVLGVLLLFLLVLGQEILTPSDMATAARPLFTFLCLFASIFSTNCDLYCRMN